MGEQLALGVREALLPLGTSKLLVAEEDLVLKVRAVVCFQLVAQTEEMRAHRNPEQ
jgi:hypothetical protein